MIIGNKYKITRKLGEGNFGAVFKGRNIRTGEEVAIKAEPLDGVSSILKKEAQIYQYIGKTDGFPTVKWFGVDDNNRYMVIDLLGESIGERVKRDGPVPLSVAIEYGKQMIYRVEWLHGKKMVHRDIKPDNFLFGVKQNANTIYLIDLGFCKLYEDENGKHIGERRNCSLIGTPNFMSMNVRNGIEPSRRDDIESIVYVMMFMVSKTDKNNEMFARLIAHLNGVGFYEIPNYDFLRSNMTL
jgi:serine/threonine protein kinase